MPVTNYIPVTYYIRVTNWMSGTDYMSGIKSLDLLEPDLDTKAKDIATEIANFVSKLDTPAKAAFDKNVKNAFNALNALNAFRVENPKPKGLQLYQKKYLTLRQALKQKQYLSLGQSLGAKTYEPKAKSLCRKQSQSPRPRVYARA